MAQPDIEPAKPAPQPNAPATRSDKLLLVKLESRTNSLGFYLGLSGVVSLGLREGDVLLFIISKIEN